MTKEKLISQLDGLFSDISNLLGDSNLLTIVKDVNNVKDTLDNILSVLEDEGLEDTK